MSILQDACNAAQARKEAAGIGTGDDTIAITESSSELADRAIFGGFDIDYDELFAISTAVSIFLAQQAQTHGLGVLFRAAWADGLLVGLMASTVAPHHDSPGPGDPRSTGPGENSGGNE